jgi:hypothetical protein
MTGFTEDIGAHPDDLNLAVSLFFITFVLFQPFSAAVGRYIGPKWWIPFIMVWNPIFHAIFHVTLTYHPSRLAGV